MRLHLGILFLYAIASLNAVAQSELPDSLDISRELNEVVVTAPENQVVGNKSFSIQQENLKMPQTTESNFLQDCKSPTDYKPSHRVY